VAAVLKATAWPTIAGLGVAVGAEVITGGWLAALIVNVSVAVPVPPALVALSVTLDVPVVVGVPDITPLDVITDSPAGNPVALKLVGLLLAVIV
jgi:hypothetical protein